MTHNSGKNKSIEPVHQIRLLGPCQLSCVVGGKTTSEIRVKIPTALETSLFQELPDSELDCFLLRRNFGKPAGLDEAQRLSLVLDGFVGAKQVHLNRDSENSVSAIVSSEREFTLSIDNADILLPRNRIEIEFDPAAEKMFAGEIRLLIFA